MTASFTPGQIAVRVSFPCQEGNHEKCLRLLSEKLWECDCKCHQKKERREGSHEYHHDN